MKRKTDLDIRKSYIWLFVLSSFFILMGTLLICQQWLDNTYTRAYDILKEKEIMISKIEFIHYSRVGDRYHITSTDNEKYMVIGKYDVALLKEYLTEGVSATVKYSQDRVPFGRKYAEEIYIGENLIVEYDAYEDDSPIVRVIFGSMAVLLGIGGFAFYGWEIKRNRETNRKRDARIQKKYGSKKKYKDSKCNE